MKKINIAVDGTAGSGKGTISKLVAKKLGYNYIDTGIMYRVLTYLLIKNNVSLDNDDEIKNVMINEFDYIIEKDRVFFENEDITEKIRSSEVNKIVSPVASKKYIREFLINIQKAMAEEKGVVMDGRDITSVVLPTAELKLYLTASLEERAKRRYAQLQTGTLEEIKASIAERDKNDIENNKTLVVAKDAIVIDTTNMTIDEVLNKVYNLAKERIEQ